MHAQSVVAPYTCPYTPGPLWAHAKHYGGVQRHLQLPSVSANPNALQLRSSVFVSSDLSSIIV